MLALADHAGDDGTCYPSIARLCQRTGLGERAVQGSIRRLKSGGHLSAKIGGGRSNSTLYALHLNPASETPFEKPRFRNPVSNDINPAYGALNPAADAPEPSITIIEPEKKERAPKVASVSGEVEDVLAAWVSQDAASSFMAYRRKHKARALTLTGAKRLATHLQAILNAGFDPSDALAMAEERGWASVEPDWYFREKAKQNGNHNGAGGTNQRRAGGPHDSMVAAFAYVASREPH